MENNQQKNPLNPKKIVLFIIYALVTVLLLVTVLSFNDIPAIMDELKNVDVGYLMLAVLFVIIYMLLYPLSLCILTRARKCDIKMSTTYSIAMTEHFFNGITPLATGGQPFQAHSYSRAKVKFSESTGLLLTNLIIYMMVTTGFSLTGLFLFDQLTAHVNSGWLPIIIIGYTLNFLVMVVMFALGISKGLRNLLVKFVRYLCHFKLLKRFEKKADDIELYFVQVQEAFAGLTKKKGAFILATLSKIASFAFLYSSSWFILRAMGVMLAPSEMFLALSATSFAITAVGFIPTPGASGSTEMSASQVFKSIIIITVGEGAIATAATTANGVMLIWRLLSYYFVMAISLMFYIGLEIYFSRKSKKEAVAKSSEEENESDNEQNV